MDEVKWRRYHILPEVIELCPKHEMEVSYGPDAVVSLGNILTPHQVQDLPTFTTWPFIREKFYTLLLMDADVPVRENPMCRSWLNWLVVNIPNIEITKGEIIAEYVGACPQKGTGLHRYIFLVYEQSDKVTFMEQKLSKHTAEGRGKFSSFHFSEKYNFQRPVAGNFFRAQWDHAVPAIQNQLRKIKIEPECSRHCKHK